MQWGDAVYRGSLYFAILLVLFAVVYTTYENSITNEYTFDDHLAIENNKDADPSSPYGLIWRHDIWGKDMSENDSHRSFRPLLITIFRFVRYYYGPTPAPLRLLSIALHGMNSLIFLLVSNKMVGCFEVAVAASLLFAAHPIHIESVVAVVNIAEPAAACAMLLAYLLYQYASPQVAATSTTRRSTTLLSIIVWYLLVVIAVLLKETGIIVALMVFCQSSLSVVVHGINWRNGGKYCPNAMRTHVIWMLAATLTIISYFVFRHIHLAFILHTTDAITLNNIYHVLLTQLTSSAPSSFYLDASQLIRKAENPYVFILDTAFEKVASYMFLHIKYMFLLVYPAELCAEYAYDCIPKISDTADPRFWLAVCGYSVLAVAGVFALVHTIRRCITSTTTSEMNAESLLLGLAWMIIPFLPASGVFLRLGTLLAERLLYAPSIGFCIVTAVFLYRSATLFKPTNKFLQQLSRLVFWIAVVGGVIACIYRARIRNLDWRNDETLFRSSLEVCPRSAKLQLQVAKLEVNSGNYKQAEKHIDAAKSIDPDFCDVGYQEALLSLLYYHDEDAAIEHLANNLKCIYTSTGSWTLLSKLWEQQLAAQPRNYKLKENIAMSAREAGLTTMAINQYILAASQALEQKKYLHALKLSMEGEHLLSELDSDTKELDGMRYSGGNWRSNVYYRELYCKAQYIGGYIRQEITSKFSNPDVLSKQDKKVYRALQKYNSTIVAAKLTLSAALAADCAATEYAVMAINLLSNIYAMELQSSRTNRVELLLEVAEFSASTAALLQLQLDKSDSNNKHLLLTKILDSRITAMNFWFEAGQLSYRKSNYSNAVVALTKSMQWGVTGNVACPHCPKPIDTFPTDTFPRAPCAVMYWFVHAKSALQSDYLHSPTNIREAIAYLDAIASDTCNDSSVTIEMKSKAETQAAELMLYLTSLTKDKRRKRENEL